MNNNREKIAGNAESLELGLDDLEQISGGHASGSRDLLTGGTSDQPYYVTAVCEHCGAKAQHRMDTGRTAVCSNCGKSINLIAQGR